MGIFSNDNINTKTLQESDETATLPINKQHRMALHVI